MSTKLHTIITAAITTQTQHTKDWALEPIPNIPRRPPPVQTKRENPYLEKGESGGGSGKQKKRKRANRFQVSPNNEDAAERRERNRRAKRFESYNRKYGSRHRGNDFARSPHADDDGLTFDPEKLKIVGTCQDIEKNYFRLTSAPDPSDVRPQPVLEKSLARLTKRWDDDEDDVEYLWMCDQLKAVRQDLTVQHIQNDFTVKVYETHARIALVAGDLNEYNQCQTQLRELYLKGNPGAEAEFTAYRLLYFLYLQGNKKYQEGSSDLLHVLNGLSRRPEVRSDPAVDHALAVRKAIAFGNYARFFELFADAPNMAPELMEYMVPKMRATAVRTMLKAYKPSPVAVSFIMTTLGFSDEEEAAKYLRTGELKVAPDKDGKLVLDTKASVLNAETLGKLPDEQANSLL